MNFGFFGNLYVTEAISTAESLLFKAGKDPRRRLYVVWYLFYVLIF
jgi:hypothetical protein